MQTLLRFMLTITFLAALASPSIAGVHDKAPGTSHQLENVSAELHTYMHHHYPSSFGAHGMEVNATMLHATLHDWEHGHVTEYDVFVALAMANEAFDNMTDMFNDMGILSGRDQDKGAKQLYHEVQKYLERVDAYIH